MPSVFSQGIRVGLGAMITGQKAVPLQLVLALLVVPCGKDNAIDGRLGLRICRRSSSGSVFEAASGVAVMAEESAAFVAGAPVGVEQTSSLELQGPVLQVTNGSAAAFSPSVYAIKITAKVGLSLGR